MHRVLPDPSVSVAFCCRRGSDGTAVDPRVLLIGEKTRPQVFSYDRHREIAAVRIKLEWVEQVLGIRPAEHQNGSVDLGFVRPQLAEDLLVDLVRTRSAGAAIEALGAMLKSRRTSEHALRHAVVTHALQVIRTTEGRCPVGRIADRAGFSVRHLRRLVNDSVGVSLKTFARTRRFVAAVIAADAAEHPQWARIAADAGFYDQSHLVRDCQEICGMTPTELIRERRAQVIAPDSCTTTSAA